MVGDSVCPRRGDAPPSGGGDVFQVVGDVAELRQGQVLRQVVELLFREDR